jgi:serine/threonine-protein kinase
MAADATQTLQTDPQVSSERPLLGKVVDQRYRVLEPIGSGGMADVYKVEHVALGCHLAMKVLRQTRAESPQLVRRFSREARAASRLNSEHVVSIHDYGILP